MEGVNDVDTASICGESRESDSRALHFKFGKMMKECTRCKKLKDKSRFRKHSKMNGGLYCHCRSCESRYWRENREISRRKSQKRRAIRNELQFCWSKNIIIKAKQYWHGCANCGSTENLHLDHFIPLYLGGDFLPTNLLILCQSCNCSKGAKHPSEFFDFQTLLKIKDYIDYIGEINATT